MNHTHITPRTDDAELYYRDVCEGSGCPLYLVPADFARQLERENRELVEALIAARALIECDYPLRSRAAGNWPTVTPIADRIDILLSKVSK